MKRIRAAKGNPVTVNELLALLGRAWSRLLIYPGGLAAFGIIWLICKFQNRGTKNREPRTENHVLERPQGSWSGTRWVVLSSIVLPWLALALLPLPLAVALPRQIDIVVALALLEWPNLLAIQQNLHTTDLRRLAAALNSYPPLILATLALMQGGNSLELAVLARPPGSLASISMSALHWLGVIALVLALPPALGIGPFASDRPPTADRRPATSEIWYPAYLHAWIAGFFAVDALQIGLQLRALGLVALAALPWAGADSTGMALLRMLGAAALIAALLCGYDRLTRGHSARSWARAYLALDVALLLALLWAAYLALQSRLA